MHRERLRWSQLTAAFLLFAFLPALTFLGHGNEIFGGRVLGPVRLELPSAAMFDAAARHADQEAHVEHCHINLGSCAEQPLPSGVGFLMTQDALLPPLPVPVAVKERPDLVRAAGPVVAPPLPPPRLLL